MRRVSLGEPMLGGNEQDWIKQALRELERASHETLEADTSDAGEVELATTTETLTGTDATRAVTPDGLAALWEKGSNVASAGTISLGEGGYFHITGTTTITDIDFATAKNGRRAILVFDGALTLTHHATTLILPGAANITTAAGDACYVVQDADDNVKVVWYMRANGFPVVSRLFKNLAADATGSDVNTAQPWFPTAGAVTLAANTTYRFKGYLRLSRAAGTTSHTTSLLFGGTATIASIGYKGFCNTGDVATNIAQNGVSSEAATAIVVKAASTSATEQIGILVEGTVRITTGGTLIPQFQYSAAPGGAPTVKANSFFELVPLGSDAVEAVGTWS